MNLSAVGRVSTQNGQLPVATLLSIFTWSESWSPCSLLHHCRVGSEMTILIIKCCSVSLSTAGMKTSQARRGGHRQRGSLKHLIQRSARSPSLLLPLNSPLKREGGSSHSNSQPPALPAFCPPPQQQFLLQKP